ncbi:extracellular solute-binding protein [Vagococcus humatus]|uniref:Sugar ABC transporter substrate-binding protein n=1 Tax=Vagococcus humatus TaxID=1889241 RepID=A0A3R9YJB2_9ENTE|nr:extracellular solute-binding protein [Vagococcus humatus]RST89074.1 sugar ABC transporter substrate-binding protein [Vagococcus humatus]
MGKKKLSFLAIMALCLLFVTTGCSKGEKAKDKTSDNNEISLAVWGYDQNTEFKALVESFEDKHDAKVKIVDIDPGAYENKITTLLASGDKTDVLAMKDVGSYVNYANKKQLLDLSTYSDKLSEEDIKSYGENLESYRTEDGKLYALPFRKDTYVLFYNKKLFDKAGVSYPEKLTWESYQEMAKKMTSGSNEAEKVYGGYHHKWFPIVQATAANQTNNDLLKGKYGFLKDYYNIFLNMQNEGSVMDYATIKTTNTTYSSVFETEKAATMIMGSFYISSLLKGTEAGTVDLDWGMAPIPQRKDSNEVITYGGPAGMAVNKNAANAKLARKFVEFCSGKEGAKVLSEIGITTAYQNEEILETLFSIPGMPQDEMSKQALYPDKNGFEHAANASAAEITKVLGEEHDLIMVEDVSLDKGISNMESRIKGIK